MSSSFFNSDVDTNWAISAYETPKFAGEAKEAFDKGEYLEAAGKGGLATLSALGAIPGLGLGIRAIKGGAKAATKIDEIGEGLSSIFKSEKKLHILMRSVSLFPPLAGLCG